MPTKFKSLQNAFASQDLEAQGQTLVGQALEIARCHKGVLEAAEGQLSCLLCLSAVEMFLVRE